MNRDDDGVGGWFVATLASSIRARGTAREPRKVGTLAWHRVDRRPGAALLTTTTHCADVATSTTSSPRRPRPLALLRLASSIAKGGSINRSRRVQRSPRDIEMSRGRKKQTVFSLPDFPFFCNFFSIPSTFLEYNFPTLRDDFFFLFQLVVLSSIHGDFFNKGC